MRGWIQYYGRYNPWALEAMLRHVNLTLVGWAMRRTVLREAGGARSSSTGAEE
ncbi:group II intron maturase-specific domain-containing protein [Rhizobium aegyptiacum]|uniref:group II intron maturase-specific domain-containing protein n=1 Tax=Rhizobium aegyptiacum TaxID=1764550 RepID=UPI0009EEF43A|nr:group II intron maturase-specific domain-containing protein [Rhizobium aegyptiacum]